MSTLYFIPSSFIRFPLSETSRASQRQNFAQNYSRLHNARFTINCSGAGVMLFPLFRSLELSDKEIEAILDTNKALRSMKIESIRSRIELLQAAGLSGSALSKLVIKRPEVLTASEIDAILCFITRDFSLDFEGKIDQVQIERLLTGTEARYMVRFEQKIRLLFEFGIPKEKLIHVLNNVNLAKAVCLKSFKEFEGSLAYLQQFGGVNLILRRPAILEYNLDTQLIPRIGFLLQLSGDNIEATTSVLIKFPFYLAYTVDHVKEHVEFLHSYADLR